MNKATLIQGNLSGFNGNAALYRLIGGANPGYVIVSAIPGMPDGYPRHPETMAFPANDQGEVIDWGEISYSGIESHSECLAAIGYEIV